MTLAAPRSRQGKAFLVLAIFAAIAAVAMALLLVQSASADLPSTTTELNQNPDGPATVAPGTVITYDFVVTVTAGLPAADSLTIDGAVDSDFVVDNVGCSPAATAADVSNFTCRWAGPVGAGTYTLTLTGHGDGAGDISPATGVVCDDVNNNGLCDEVGAALVKTVADNVVDTGILSQGAGATVADATNFPGTPHTFVFTLAAGVTCESDVDFGSGGDNVDCIAADVVVGGSVVCTASAPVVGDADLVDSSTVTVTITPTTGASGDCTVTLLIKYVGPCEDCSGDDTDLPDVTATKTYDASIAGGTLCHLDVSDAATEDATGNTDGILFIDNNDNNDCVQDDVDDAIGSFHAACIEGSDLTFAANGADITWSIIPVAGGPTPNPPGGQGFAGPNNGEPCTKWGAGTTGTQNITATYAPGAPSPSINYYWNEYCVSGDGCFDSSNDSTTDGPLPLIKEWNTIDFTKIIGVSGDVGDNLNDNSGELAAWSSRDCVDSDGFCGRANLDGTTRDISGVLFPFAGKDCPPFSGGCISANGASFIDYTMGSHSDAGGAYSGPVDGAQQTYRVEGDCGSVRLEEPTEIGPNTVHILNPGDAQDVLSSDKGVGFQVLPNANGAISTTASNADCQADACLTVTIDTQEDNLFHSPPLFEANTEVITVCWHVGPPTNKQPLLAWAGQRVVLEHDWSFTDINDNRSCPFGVRGESVQGGPSFLVRYLKEFGNGGFVSDFGHGAATGPDFMVVRVNTGGDSNTDPEDQCISRVMYESQDQGEQDVVAHVVACAPVFFPQSASVQGGPNIDPDTCSVISEQVAFLVYYMKFEDIKLALLPDETTHDCCPTESSTAVGAPAGAATTTQNVSANVLARATVRGWTLTDNCPARDSAVGSNGEFIPANRCIFPDDWLFKAGGDASDVRKNYDNYGGSTAGCSNVAGPYSLLDPIVFDSEGFRDIVCGDSMAPHAPFGDGFRETNFPDGVIDANDAPMPSALIRFQLSGSGFLLGTEKHNPNSQFDVTHIPAEPWISPINADGSGYQWNSWGTGPKSGVYHYWTDFADHGPEVLSCAGPSSGLHVGDEDSCPASDNGDPVATGGYNLTRVYSDEHGVAMTWINGDANLTFEGCASTVAAAGHKIVLLNGFFCQPDNIVGSSTLNALADYPDKRKHFAILSDDVTITWTWGGIKNITVEPGAGPQFHYVVFHVTDRDGFCGNSPSLHPVLGEPVEFLIDSDAGLIVPNGNGDAATAPGGTSTVSDHGKSASTTTFDTAAHDSIANGGWTVEPVQETGECQAWIHVSESQLQNVDVIVTAFDPEGTVTFDTTDINPTPTPSPTPSPEPPTPTPFTLHLKWGDSDCDGNVAPRDGQAVLKHFLDQAELSQSQPCPAMGERVTVGGVERKWGDWDCNGAVAPRDEQADLKHFLSQAELSQTEPCPDIASAVDVVPIGHVP